MVWRRRRGARRRQAGEGEGETHPTGVLARGCQSARCSSGLVASARHSSLNQRCSTSMTVSPSRSSVVETIRSLSIETVSRCDTTRSVTPAAPGSATLTLSGMQNVGSVGTRCFQCALSSVTTLLPSASRRFDSGAVRNDGAATTRRGQPARRVLLLLLVCVWSRPSRD